MNRIPFFAFFLLAGCLDNALPSAPDLGGDVSLPNPDTGVPTPDSGTAEDVGEDSGCRLAAECAETLGDGVDSNNDGSDGYTSLTVFVDSKNGSDTLNDGLSPSTPVATLGKAIEISTTEGRPTILLTRSDDYIAPPNWTVNSATFNLWGGYDSDFNSLPVAGGTAISNPSYGPTLTLKSESANLGMIEFRPPQHANKHAITLRIENTYTSFHDVTVTRGLGQDGSNGDDAGPSVNGGHAAGKSAGVASCHGKMLAGGAGGDGGICLDAFPASDGGHGTNGLGVEFMTGGGSAGLNACVASELPQRGTDGASRTDQAAHGIPGATSAITGYIKNGLWTNGERGKHGTVGANGDSGAGGGGGSAYGNVNGTWGGGGGSGGCGGEPGQGGENGGDSIGILALGRATVTTGVKIAGGKGGKGGNGGKGGVPGLAGNGALAQASGAGNGGIGGNGGNGGRGGSGAGGNGGSVYGIAYTNAAQIDSPADVAAGTLGPPGNGGTSLALSVGEPGRSGVNQSTFEFEIQETNP